MLNERILTILNFLLKQPDTNVTELSQQLGLSKRQINYSIQIFNQQVKDLGLPPVKKEKNGNFVVSKKLLSIMGDDKLHNIVGQYSKRERQVIILIYLSLAIDYTSLYHLVSIMQVSENTILQDLKDTSILTNRYRIYIDYDRSKGYKFVGKEYDILRMISDLCRKYKFLFKLDSLNYTMDENNISEQDIVHFIRHVEKIYNMSYTDESIKALTFIIRITVIRARNTGLENFIFDNVYNTKVYETLSEYLFDNFKISRDYVAWIIILIQSANTVTQIKIVDDKDENILKSMIHDLVERFKDRTLVQIKQQDLYEERLFSHLKPACFRVRYGFALGIDEINVTQSNTNHLILLKLIKELVHPIEVWIGKNFPEDELVLLSYYFGYQLTDGVQEKGKYRAVVVCTNGMVMSKVMLDLLDNLFPEILFISAISEREFYQWQSDYDLVFTMIPLKTKLPQYLIDPIMDYDKKIGLRYRVLKDIDEFKIGNKISNFMSLIRKYADIKNEDSLEYELKKILVENDIPNVLDRSFDKFPHISDYIKEEYIQIFDEPMDVHEALKKTVGPLEIEGVISKEYTDSLYEQIISPNNYSFLGEKMAIPHAEASKGIYKDGVAMGIFKKPLIFPNGECISFLVPLAFYKTNRHLKAINELSDIATDSQLIDNLLKCTTTTEVLDIIKESWES